MKTEISCLARNHRTIATIDTEFCVTCLENEITRLRSYVQRGCDLLHPMQDNEEVMAYRQRAEAVLQETIGP